MVIPVEDTTFIYCDNQSVVMNTSLPDFKTKKKINYILYHFVYEGSEKDEWRCGRVVIDDNRSDLMTKFYISENNIIRKVRMLMYNI